MEELRCPKIYKKICEWCGREYPTSAPKQKYCDKGCSNPAQKDGYDRIKQDRINTIMILRMTGMSNVLISKYIGVRKDTVSSISIGIGLQPRQYKKVTKVRQQRMIAQPKKEKEKHICKRCGITFPHKGNSFNVFCSTVCSTADKRENVKPILMKIYWNICRVCGKTRSGGYQTDVPCSRECELIERRMIMLACNKQKHIGNNKTFICKICGKEHKPEYGDQRQVVCSDVCEKENIRILRNDHRRMRKRRKRSTGYVRYRDLDIFNRDEWICQICRKIVNKDVKVPDYDAPTIDHIKPLSKGGIDAPSNVQLACFICNSRKGNMYGEQYKLLY